MRSFITLQRSLLMLLMTSALLSCRNRSQPQTRTIPAQTPFAETVTENLPGAARDPVAQANTPLNTSGLNIQPKLLYQGLEHPWGMDWLPDGSVLITERPGRIKHLSADWQTIKTIEGGPSVFASGQGGLLDISLHPRFADNQWVYFTYAQGDRSQNRTQVARAKFDGHQLNNWNVIFEVEHPKRGTQHYGSRLAWLPDETLLISIGDGGNPPISFDGDLIRKQAQSLDTHFGKVLRINADGSIPADNPFVNQTNAKPEIWSYGHRNIQGLAVDRSTGNVWATEHGSRGGDELNFLEVGKNYGWPLVSFSKEYTSFRNVAPVSSRPGFQDPKVEWTPSIAPSGLAFYRSDRVPAWNGNLFAGALVSEAVFRLGVDAQGQVRELDVIQLGQRVRDVRQGPDGYLYVLTDNPSGRLVRLEPET